MYLLGDLGGTRLKIAFSKDLKNLVNFKVFNTPSSYYEFLKLTRLLIKDLKLKIACYGLAGVLDLKKEKLIFAPNLKDYENKKIKNDLEKILNCKVILENDAFLGGLGEAKFGVGKNLKKFGYLTLGTGVGGALINQEEISDHFSIFEPGHSFLVLAYYKNKAEFLIETEALLGGKSIEKISGLKPFEIKNKKFWDDYHLLLSIFLVNALLFWGTNNLVLGGGLSAKLNLKILKRNIKRLLPFNFPFKILKSKLKEKSVLWGALVKIKNYLKQ